jgi:hypothetical protein
MPERTRTPTFDLATRSAERAREQEGSGTKSQSESQRREDAQKLSSSIEQFYGSKLPGQFETRVDGTIVTVTKKVGGSAFKIQLFGTNECKLSGGSGPVASVRTLRLI